MNVEILTKEDLFNFRIQLLEDIKGLLQNETESKEWLRSSEVCKKLKISSGTLRNLRVTGTLHPKKFENSRIWYYPAEEINAILNAEK